MTVSDSVDIAVDPMTLWAAAADPTQMGRWSPENTGANGEGGRPLEVGDVFVGSNKRGPARWHTECVVTESDPGSRFAFVVRRIGVGVPRVAASIATWSYDFEPTATGTRVTETWTDNRAGWPDAIAAVFDKVVTRGRLFADFQRRNIARTLARMKADFES